MHNCFFYLVFIVHFLTHTIYKGKVYGVIRMMAYPVYPRHYNTRVTTCDSFVIVLRSLQSGCNVWKGVSPRYM